MSTAAAAGKKSERHSSPCPSPILNTVEQAEQMETVTGLEDSHMDDSDLVSSGLVPVARNQCPHCFAQFALEKNFVEHMWAAHGSRRPFRCDDCGIFLSYRSSLYNHRKIHSDKRPFACTECSAKFRWNNSLKYHMTRSHQKTAPLPPVKINRRRDLSAAVQKARTLNQQMETKEKATPVVPTDMSSSTNLVNNQTTTGTNEVSSIMQLLGLAAAAGAAAGAASGQNKNGASHRKRQTPTRKTITKILEPQKCDGCGKKFFLPEALDAHQESCAKFQELRRPLAKSGRKTVSSSSSESLVDKTIEEMILSVSSGTKSPPGTSRSSRQPSLPEVSPPPALIGSAGSGANGRRDTVKNLNLHNGFADMMHESGFSNLHNSSLPFSAGQNSAEGNGIPSLTTNLNQATPLNHADNGSAACGGNHDDNHAVLSETLSQICTQQEALMHRLEGFERWVQQRVGKMENILNAMVLNGQYPTQIQ